MFRVSLLAVSLSLLLTAGCATTEGAPTESTSNTKAALAAKPWTFNATIIEACSCPMFCQCYFNLQPADHPGCCPEDGDPRTPPRYCRFNNAYRVNRGSFGDTKLDGAKFWVAGDLGGDFTKGEMVWAILHFDPSVTPAQREGITTAPRALYPVKWGSFTIGKDHPMEWTASRERAVARLDGGRVAEVVLKKNQGMTDEPIVMHNLRYWGAPRNDGFVMMANEVEAYRAGDKPYEFKGTNGFMITVDCSSSDAAPTKPTY